MPEPSATVSLAFASPRTRLYAGAVGIAACCFLLGHLANNSFTWIEVSLPLTVASVLALGLAVAEVILFLSRARAADLELRETHRSEIELAQQLALARQGMLNHVSRLLIDNLDFQQMPAEVFQALREFFRADLVAVWVFDRGQRQFLLRGLHGLDAEWQQQFEVVGQSPPDAERLRAEPRLVVIEDMPAHTSGGLGRFCAQQEYRQAVLAPILRRQDLAGVLGVFYRDRTVVTEPLTTELQTVANLIASTVLAEELYRDLLQVQKIDSIGSLTSGVIHDFNNVLAAILACASYVKQQTPANSQAHRYLEAAEQSAHRGAALTKQLLSFARREGMKLVVVDPNQLIDQVLKIIERSFGKSILLQRQLAPTIGRIEVDPAYLEQVVLNIAVNARDAMAEGGILTVSTRNARLERSDPHRPATSLPDGDYVVLGFRDTGSGMDEATMARIFDPFFTTKPPGKGTGLGLAMVRGIVAKFGGEITVQSAPGKGAFFQAWIPATTKPLPVLAADAKLTDRGGSECILLAEDEDVIREMAQLGLEAKGYRVLTAADGAAAMAIYREHHAEIDLAIIDMVMPRLNGAELVARMRELNPGARVIVSSGFSHDQEGQRMLQEGCLGYLQKPYNTEALNHLVRSILDSGL